MARQSFFGDYPIKVIHNGISLETFTYTKSDFREKHGIGDKKLVLGVAFGWGERKGLDVFLELDRRLDDSYQIVLVGTDESVDKQLPDSIISIHRTANQTELAEIYSAADVYANPTREEVLGLVNLEALACGTPVITFNAGGSPECVDETCGVVVPKNDVDALEAAIRRVTTEKPFSKEACRAYASNFDADRKFGEYVKLYGL
jgi:glycosyltransferase involved in cell wall biosynthesis